MIPSAAISDPKPPLPPAPTLSNPRRTALLAWLIILAYVAVVLYRNDHSTRLQDVQKEFAQMQFRLMGRLAMGIKSLIAQTGQPLPAGLGDMSKLVDSMQDKAKTPEDNLSVAIIAGEVEGKEQALAKLGALAKDQPAPDLSADIAALRTIYTSGPSALDAAAQARLVKRHEFFGQVALSFGTAADTEPRQSLEASARRLLVSLGILGMAFLAVLLASFILFIIAIVCLATDKIHCAYVPAPLANTAYLEGFALYLVLYISLGLFKLLIGSTSMAWYLAALLILPVVMYWIARRGATSAEERQALGWHRGRGWHIEIPLGIAGYLAGLPILAGGVVITAVLIKITHIEPTPNPVEEELFGSAWQVLAVYALACGFAPVMEETMFRGALFHHLRRRWGWLVSTAVTGFIFAIIHPYGWVAVPMLGSIAVVLAALREWRGSIIASMTAHALHNFIATTVMLILLR